MSANGRCREGDSRRKMERCKRKMESAHSVKESLFEKQTLKKGRKSIDDN